MPFSARRITALTIGMKATLPDARVDGGKPGTNDGVDGKRVDTLEAL